MRCQFCAKQTVLTGTDEQCGNCVQCNSQAVKKVATDVVMWF
jgi:hypothetical protein